MVLDSEDHRAILLEMLDRMQFQGSVRRVIYELGDAIERATIAPPQADIVIGEDATPDRLAVIIGDDPQAALALLGVTQVPVEDDT